MTICYFGIYNPEFGRNKVYIRGLKENGVSVIECRDNAKGLRKFWNLWRKHKAIKNDYDIMIVGYPGHIVVPFAKIISQKPVVLDALCTLYEGEIISRGKYAFNPLKKFWIRLIDRLAVTFADLILVETNAQKEFFIRRFGLKGNKVIRIFTGVDDTIYGLDYNPNRNLLDGKKTSNPDVTNISDISKKQTFTVVFRGKLLPEAGVKYIIQAAKILEKENIDFLLLGGGFLEKEIKALIEELKPSNLEWITNHIPAEEMQRKMLECHVSLGQFENHERLERTIPHKAFESIAMGLPYITGRMSSIIDRSVIVNRTSAVTELLTDGRDCLMVNCADADDLAAKILLLKNNPELARNLAENGLRLYRERLTPRHLANDILIAVSRMSNSASSLI